MLLKIISTPKGSCLSVPEAVHASVRGGIKAWGRIQECLRELSLANKETLIPSKSKGAPERTPPKKSSLLQQPLVR